MIASEKPNTYQKALSLNLDSKIFAPFAEIGAGQEVARWLLRVGGASGTVAKTTGWKASEGMVSAEDLHRPEPLDFPLQYLLSSRLMETTGQGESNWDQVKNKRMS
jgi:hypothetical protein